MPQALELFPWENPTVDVDSARRQCDALLSFPLADLAVSSTLSSFFKLLDS